MIKEVKINNFRGIDFQHHILNGENYNLYGENETFKTTFLEAILWALNGKLLDGSSRITNILPRNKELDTLVSVEVILQNNTRIKREWQQKYSVNRETGDRYLGNATQELFIDEVKQTLTKGQNLIYTQLGFSSDLILGMPKNLDLFMLLFVPRSITQIDNKTARDFFASIVGEPNTHDVIADYPDYFKEALANVDYKIETLEKTSRDNLKETTIITKEINSKLDNLRKRKADFNPKDLEELENEHAENIKLQKEIKEELSKTNEDLIGENNIKIRNIEHRIATLRNEKDDQIATVNAKYEKIIDDLRKERQELGSKREQLDVKIGALINATIKSLINEKDKLKEDYVANNKPRMITAPISQEHFDIYESVEFKQIRIDKNAKIEERAKEISLKIKEIEKEIENLTIEALKIDKEIMRKERLINETLESSEKTAIIADIKRLYEKKVLEFNKEIELLKNANKEQENSDDNLRISELNAKHQELVTAEKELRDKIIDLKVLFQTVEKQIDELNEELKTLNEKAISTQQINVFVNKFNRDKIVHIDKMVEKLFGDEIKIDLFEYTKEETIKPTFNILVRDKDNELTPLINGINNGQFDIQVIKLTNKLREVFEIPNSFVLIDEISYIGDKNRERLFNLGQQVISTEAKKNDKGDA